MINLATGYCTGCTPRQHRCSDCGRLWDEVKAEAACGLTPEKRAEIDRQLDLQEDAQALACARGIHPSVTRGRCDYCNRPVRA